MCKESIKTPFTSHNSSAPKMICDHGKIRVKFDGIWLRHDGIPFIHGNVANTYFVYKLDTLSRDLNTDFRLGNSVFGAVKLTKNADLDKYGYSGYSIGFDARSQFPLSNSESG